MGAQTNAMGVQSMQWVSNKCIAMGLQEVQWCPNTCHIGAQSMQWVPNKCIAMGAQQIAVGAQARTKWLHQSMKAAL